MVRECGNSHKTFSFFVFATFCLGIRLMTYIFHRQPATELPYAVKGDGPYIFDQTGKRYLDASGGAAVSCLGYSHPRIIEAIRQQLDRIAFAHTAFFTSEPAESLAEFLVSKAPEGIGKVCFVSGGSEANEAALKLARQYFVEIGQHKRRYFIARRQSYHGNTLGVLAVGGNTARRTIYEPILHSGTLISPCYAYRGKCDNEDDETYGLRVANELETAILELGTESVAAFVAEPVVGATLGAVPPVRNYFQRIREICDKYGVMLILDEVMCGMGRTGSLFACAQEDLKPDMITVAKGLSGGYQPLGALLLQEKIYETIVAGSGFFQHGHTYTGHSTACAAAIAVQMEIEEQNLLENVRLQGELLYESLCTEFAGNDYIGDIRGMGLFWGLELVADRNTKKPFDPRFKMHERIKLNALENGLICYPGSGTADGVEGNHILLAPPYTISSGHIEEIVGKLVMTLRQTIQEIQEH
jgi:adenosylmethionine-8-amino-7-oxononanoate aminotransferase